MASDIEYEAALRRTFVDRQKEFIVVTSRIERARIGAVGHGIKMGWLVGELVEGDEQSAEFVCRLTDEGRKHFGLEASRG